MTTDTLRCPSGHEWRRPASSLAIETAYCPTCGAPAAGQPAPVDEEDDQDDQEYEGYGPH